MDVRSVLARDEWVVAVGDIAECSGTGDEATSALVSTMSLATVLALGDLAYPDGTSQDFECFNASWGRHKGRIRPVPGNHEYRTTDAAGYFGYFGAAAGDPSKGYYSWDDGYWHFIALNSNCKEIGGCEAGSPQEQWLRADLKAHPGHACTLAFMQHPRFSSGSHGPQAEVDALWRALYEARVDIVLSGHDHSYERFAPQTPDGVQVVDGIRQFVVGTGGASLRPFGKPEPNSVFRQSTADGALRLHLGASSYAWAFLTAPSGAATDTGSFPCATP
jgi:3',5'-cyclic AMP phosphodiesterase CpdA